MKFFYEAVKGVYKASISLVARILGLPFPETERIIRYAISGGLGGVLQVFFLWIFVDLFGVWYVHGVVGAFLVTLVIVFFLQKFWTFQDYSKEYMHEQSFSYALIAVGTLGLNIVLMYVLVDLFGVWHVLAQAVVVGVVGVMSFFMNKMFTFKDRNLAQ